MVERKHQHILNTARALKFQSGISLKYWNHCILTAVYLINRTPSSTLNKKSPYQVLFNKKLNYLHLKVFECLAFATTIVNGRHKFDPRAKRCLFIGYPFGIKGYTLLDVETKKIFVSRNVVFYENLFPFKGENSISNTQLQPDLNNTSSTQNPIVHNETVTATPIPNVSHDVNPLETESQNAQTSDHDPTGDSQNLNAPDSSSHTTPTTHLPRRSARIRRAPTHLQDFICQQAASRHPSQELYKQKGQNSSGNHYPLSANVSYEKLSTPYKAFLTSITSQSEPRNYQEAKNSPEWCAAMKAEIEALELNDTWVLVDLPPDKEAIGCKWVYKIKFNADGSIERFKARLVAKGYTQQKGLDYHETFSPVAKLVKIRTLLAVATIKGWNLFQFDVNNAFLHGELDEEVYMELPPGYSNGDSKKVCRIKKSLYGLKQASRQWYSKLSKFIIEQGYIQSKADYSLFTKSTGNSFTAVLVYVDDIIVAGDCIDTINHLKASLHDQFRIKDLGKLKYFLDIEVARSTQGIHICQRKYALDILSDSGTIGSAPARIPLDQNVKLTKDEGEFLPDPAL